MTRRPKVEWRDPLMCLDSTIRCQGCGQDTEVAEMIGIEALGGKGPYPAGLVFCKTCAATTAELITQTLKRENRKKLMDDTEFAQFCFRSFGITADRVGESNVLALGHKAAKGRILRKYTVTEDSTVLQLRSTINKVFESCGLESPPKYVNGLCVRCGVSQYTKHMGVDRLTLHREDCPNKPEAKPEESEESKEPGWKP